MVGIVPGSIITVAGTGDPGYAGDGGPALKAMLNEPKSITIAGNYLYIADAENHRIRRLDLQSGIIITVAGIGSTTDAPRPAQAPVPAGPPLEEDPLADPDAKKESRFVQLPDQSGTVRFVTGAAEKGRFKGDGGPAAQATLNFPSAIAVDSRGALYIADTFNHRIRRVDAASGVISTVSGTGAPRFSGDNGPADKAALNEPVALALDERTGRLYIADLANYRVRAVDLATGQISTYAGNGSSDYDGDGQPAVQAGLSGPSGLALDTEGNLYISDTFSGRIRLVDILSGAIMTVAGDGTEYRYQGMPKEFSTSLARPAGIALAPDGKLYITDSDNHLIRMWNPTSKIITSVAGKGTPEFFGDGGPANHCGLNYPFGVALDGTGNIYIADTFNHRIRMIAATTG
ncbi:MAG TPA: SMP-30/gluconolactonase/LRE family protein [Nitrospirales bacterium]